MSPHSNCPDAPLRCSPSPAPPRRTSPTAYFPCVVVVPDPLHELRCLDLRPLVTFTVVGHTRVVPAGFTTAYESALLRGRALRGLPPEERMHALELLIDKYSPNDKVVGLKYAEKSFHRTEIIRIDIDCASGKQKVIRPTGATPD